MLDKFDKYIANAKMAKEVWENLKSNEKLKLEKLFHLRPIKSGGVTIVSTLPFAPMRGQHFKEEDELRKRLKELCNSYRKLISVDENKVRNALSGFKERDNNNCRGLLEEYFQAMMINMMMTDTGKKILQDKLNAHKPIRFIASELYLEQGPNKVDIVGYDGKDLYLFELKKDRTTKVPQVSNYVNYYTKHKETLIELLSNYPMNSIETFERIRGVMVMKYAENSSTGTWEKLAKDNHINILFYKPSLSFEQVV